MARQPERKKGRIPGITGAILMGVGVLLLLAAGAYYAYGAAANARLDELSFSAPRPSMAMAEPGAPLPAADQSTASEVKTPAGGGRSFKEIAANSPGEDAGTKLPNDATEQIPDGATQQGSLSGVNAPEQSVGDDVADVGEVARDAEITPAPASGEDGAGVAPIRGREDPRGGAAHLTAPDAVAVEAPTEDGRESAAQVSEGPMKSPEIDELLAGLDIGADDGDTKSSATAVEAALVEDEAAAVKVDEVLTDEPTGGTRIRIPALEIDSIVKDMEILFLRDSFSWQTPADIVGHLPATADLGAVGQGWYFGHLESPTGRQGNVFRKLPRIPRLLNDGEVVTIFLEEGDRRYEYQVYNTEVVPEEELQITDSGLQDITLVTCYPRLHYDKRLLVTAALVEVTEIGPSQSTGGTGHPS